MLSNLCFGVLTISDRCYAKEEEDKSGPLLINLILDNKITLQNCCVVKKDIVPDDENLISSTLVKWSDEFKLHVIITTGGTGFSKRDVTPEATKKIIDKEALSLSYAMLMEGLKNTKLAMLSRAVCGIRGNTLIINFPGSPKAVKECFLAIYEIIPHAADLILDSKELIQTVHNDMQELNTHKCCHRRSNGQLELDNIAGRHRESPFPMVSYEKSINILKSTITDPPKVIKVSIWEAHGKVLAENIFSQCDLPPFRASIKDGYAVLAADGKGLRKVVGGIEAGQIPRDVKIKSGYCVRINTGAPIPNDATAVVQVEDTKLIEKTEDGKDEKLIEILTEPSINQDIRSIGSDIKKGSEVLKSGMKLGAVEMGILAACGCSDILVTKTPVIGILSTGNELQNPGEPLQPGHVYDSNKITLVMLLKENGYDAKDFGIVKDEESIMIEAIKNSLNKVDVLITTGSVSMGDRDMLKPILQKVFHSTIHFGRVNLKPGKPTTYATCDYNGLKKYIMCLPGNPVSATVTAYLYVFPLLNLLLGNNTEPIIIKAKVTQKYILDPRPEFARAILEWKNDEEYPLAFSTGNQISSKLTSCKNANALLILPEKSDKMKAINSGELVSAILLTCNKQNTNSL